MFVSGSTTWPSGTSKTCGPCQRPDGVGQVSAVFGPLIAGVGWFTITGTLTPALVLLRFGRNQRNAPLEKLAH